MLAWSIIGLEISRGAGQRPDVLRSLRMELSNRCAMSSQNIYQMVIESLSPALPGAEPWRHGGPVIVRRNSWNTGVGEIVGFSVPPAAWPRDKAPYFGNPKVYALIKYSAGAPYTVELLSSPGTFGYERLQAAPPWWRAGLTYPVVGYSDYQRIELAADGSLTFPPRQRRR
jgi:hypothetical protein